MAKLNSTTEQIQTCIQRRIQEIRPVADDPNHAGRFAARVELERLRYLTPFYRNERHAHDVWTRYIAGCYRMVRDLDPVFDAVRDQCDQCDHHIGVLGGMGLSFDIIVS